MKKNERGVPLWEKLDWHAGAEETGERTTNSHQLPNYSGHFYSLQSYHHHKLLYIQLSWAWLLDVLRQALHVVNNALIFLPNFLFFCNSVLFFLPVSSPSFSCQPVLLGSMGIAAVRHVPSVYTAPAHAIMLQASVNAFLDFLAVCAMKASSSSFLLLILPLPPNPPLQSNVSCMYLVFNLPLI